MNFFKIVKNGKFGKAKEYLKKNSKSQIRISFKLIENRTKILKKEVRSTPIILKDTIIYLNNENIIM